ncbi:MAG: hypothetical protein IT454_19375 [Planctomycetes bacterium]|nr:hypothetical protein [Planctomycetota bacterium]
MRTRPTQPDQGSRSGSSPSTPPSAGRPRERRPDPVPPAVESAPRRTPLPRVSPPKSDSTRPAQPSDGPSSTRLRERPLSPSTGRVKDDSAGTQPSSGARPIDRERILDRYKRPNAPATPATKSADDVRAARDAERAKSEDQVRDRRDADRAKRAEDVSQARNEHRASEIKSRRDQQRAAEVKSARDLYAAEQSEKYERREIQQAAARTARLRAEYASNPHGKSKSWAQGSCASKLNGYGLYLGFGLGFSWCNPYGAYWSHQCWPWWYWNSWDYCDNYWYGWGYGGYSYSWCSHPFSWTHRWWFGCWPRYSYWWPTYSARVYYSPPVYYASAIADDSSPDVVIYDYDDDNDVVVVGGGGNVEVQRVTGGETSSAPLAPQSAPQVDPTVAGVLDKRVDTLARLALQYLTDGDQAFRERRYGDAAHFYAKAIEFRPDEGVLYLVLSDALFATGDYHYGAFALRRALELDASLADGDLDKHEFYSDAAEFDRQLQTLERFLADHATDGDARLLLAANYLFSQQSRRALELLESSASESVRGEAAGALLLEAARKAEAQKKP